MQYDKLEVVDLCVSVVDNRRAYVQAEEKEILKGVNLVINRDEVHAIMGPNGSGKSTLAASIAGAPGYKITSGDILLTLDGNTQSILDLTVNARARAGIFLARQTPTAVDGITLSNFLRTAKTAIDGVAPNVRTWIKELDAAMEYLKMDKSFASRSLNVGFSGGEKKRAEILQLEVLRPKFAILDETDSGLDVDALKTVCDGINRAKLDAKFGALLITHYTHILEYVEPDFVHVFADGQIVESGGSSLAKKLETSGYAEYIK
ncbi:MAG: Fe-S cluster assembly ATPase SufC [Candidatus Ancillula trichonymphae]|jgi:Fe-S cluster assembly ATP-binding protein|nr:Fe-S cluster assembly ATPase SufC [Candidatus Ancillula trichonymphae]